MPHEDPLVCSELTRMSNAVDAIGKKMDALQAVLSTHIVHEADFQHKIGTIMDAFPDGPENHRRAHEMMIDAASEQKKFWSELRLDIAKKGAWGVIVILVGLVIIGVSAKLGIGGVK